MSRRGPQATDLLQDDSSVVVVEEGPGAVTVELPDGTQAIVHNAITEEPSQDEMEGVAIQLEDGRIGYLYGETLLQAVSSDLPPPTPTRDSFPCAFPNCFKTYTTNHHLKTHVRSHTGQRPHICPECNKRFTTGYALKSHRRTHTGEKPYQCPEDQCAKCFKTSGDLQKHVRTHTGERPFKCEVCGKSFTTSNIRKVHMRVHTGEKPYQCQHEGCGRKFASATNYRNHCRIHTGEKPYVCSIKNCGRRFTEYSSLYKHHLVHNEVKRFHCNICGRFYRQPSTLAVHRRTVHGLVEGTSEEQPVVWVSNSLNSGLEVDLLDEEGPAGTSPSTLLHLPPTMVKKEEQVVEGNLLGLEQECIPLPTVQVTGLGHPNQSTSNLELEASDGGPILVFTHHLDALQELETVGTDGGQEPSLADTVEVIQLNDFSAVAESTVTEQLPSKPQPDQKRKIILIKEVNASKSKKLGHC